MRFVVAPSVILLTLGWTALAGPIENSKLIGVWELTDAAGEANPPHWRVEFLKDGKLRMTSKRVDKVLKVEGRKVTPSKKISPR